jgi:hypothetical protein
MSDNRVLSNAKCPCGCVDRPVYKWWPHIKNVEKNGPFMYACQIFFDRVWAPEGDGEED